MLKSVPTEVEEFFSVRGNFILAVKGPAGAGKTIFALECLRQLSSSDSCIYLSARVDPSALYSQHPWVKDFLPPQNVVDATAQPPPYSGGISEAIRYGSLPEFMRELYRRVSSLKGEKPLVVVDSFDAVCQAAGEDIGKATSLIAWLTRKISVKAILVSESDEKTLDYTVDGIVELRSSIVDSRLVREMWLRKLRGVNISSPVYLFTLAGGRLKLMERIELESELEKKAVDQPEVRLEAPEELSPPLRDVMLVEYEPKARLTAAYTLISPMILAAAKSGMGVVLVAPSIPRAREIEKYFSKYCERNMMKLIPLQAVAGEGAYWRLLEDIARNVDELRSETGSVLLIVSYSGLIELLGEEPANKAVSSLVTKAREESDAMIFTSDRPAPAVEGRAGRIVKVYNLHGYTLVAGEKPWTPLHSISIAREGDGVVVKLTPML